MNIRDIPVRVVGPGSQPTGSDGDAITYMDMPGDMSTFVTPVRPEPEDVLFMDGAREAMDWLGAALDEYEPGGEPALADLSGLDEESRDVVNQILGEGEVSIVCDGQVRAHTQESVLAGVWRTLFFDRDDRVVCDLLEVAEIPKVVGFAAECDGAVDTAADGVAGELANALPILVELQSHHEKYAQGNRPHSINLTLLPLSEPELEFIDQRLGRGPVDILSRAYGKCEVISTKTAGIWWVRYYNSMGVLILNTLEVADVPSVVKAAPEDLVDSAERLKEILEPYWSEVA
ncbi:MAG: hydrogenase expression/formation protein [Gammaproteobacteria bacterium]|nr:hydrogenase expression/formation protein [Gammaproteobacteria bacterium]